MRYIMFLDESGDNNLRNIIHDYPIFVLGGIIAEEQHYNRTIRPSVIQFKDNFFGSGIILHTREIKRNIGRFSILKDSVTRKKFYQDINLLIDQENFYTIAGIIDKQQFVSRYIDPYDPYRLLLEFLLERFFLFLQGNNARGDVVVESRGAHLDTQIKVAFDNLLKKGNKYIKNFALYINTPLQIEKKAPDNIGLQIADLVVTPIGRNFLKKKPYIIEYSTIEHKFLRNSGRYKGIGLKIFP